MPTENRTENRDAEEAENDDMFKRDIEDASDIDYPDGEFQEEIDFADEVFIDNFEYLPPDDE